ncbi:unnamed protein product [Ixodes pacificus]
MGIIRVVQQSITLEVLSNCFPEVTSDKPGKLHSRCPPTFSNAEESNIICHLPSQCKGY